MGRSGRKHIRSSSEPPQLVPAVWKNDVWDIQSKSNWDTQGGSGFVRFGYSLGMKRFKPNQAIPVSDPVVRLEEAFVCLSAPLKNRVGRLHQEPRNFLGS